MPVLPLHAIPAHEEVLFDANVLAYGLLRTSAESDALIDRCIAGEINGFTTIEVLNEVYHRLMLYEASSKGLISRNNARSLKGRISVVPTLTDYWVRVMDVPANGIAVLPLDEFRFQRAHRLRQQHPLLCTDSLILAAADQFGIPALATNDADFASVPWLTVYRPTDVP